MVLRSGVSFWLFLAPLRSHGKCLHKSGIKVGIQDTPSDCSHGASADSIADVGAIVSNSMLYDEGDEGKTAQLQADQSVSSSFAQ